MKAPIRGYVFACSGIPLAYYNLGSQYNLLQHDVASSVSSVVLYVHIHFGKLPFALVLIVFT